VTAIFYFELDVDSVNPTPDQQLRIDRGKFIGILIINFSNFLFGNFHCLIIAVSTCFRYITYFKIEKMLHRYLHTTSIFETSFFLHMVIEVLFCLAQPYTFTIGKYFIIKVSNIQLKKKYG
jgi:hypothetical protein